MHFRIKNFKKIPTIAVAISALDKNNKNLPNWMQKVIDITEKPQFTGGIATVSLLSYLFSGGSSKVYICKDPNKESENIKYTSLTYSYFDVGILGITIGVSVFAKFCDKFCEQYYQIALTGISIIDFICDVTNLSNYSTTETLYNDKGEVVYEIV